MNHELTRIDTNGDKASGKGLVNSGGMLPVGISEPSASNGEGNGADVEIERDYMVIRIGDEEIDFFRKKKRREFVKFVHQRKLQTGEDTFKFQDMVEDMAQQTGRTIESERFEDDLFKGQSKEFHLLFQVVNRRKDLYRIKI